MKKIYVVVAWLLTVGYAEVSAQNSFFTVDQPLGQGDVLLGGSVYGNTFSAVANGNENRQFSYTISPVAQFFLSDRIVFSARLPVAFARNRSMNDQQGASQENSNRRISAIPGLTYIHPIGERIFLFVEGYTEGGWVFSRTERQPQDQIDTQNQFLLGAGMNGGVSLLINDHFWVECTIARLNYYWRNLELDGGDRMNIGSGFSFTPGSPSFSFSYRIPSSS